MAMASPEMNEEYRNWYRDNSSTLCHSTADIDTFLMYLTDKRMMSEAMQAEVKAIRGQTMQAHKLYTHLSKYGFDRIDDVVECLRKSDNEEPARKFADFKELCMEKFGLTVGPQPPVLDFFEDTNPLAVKVIKAQGLMGKEGNRYKMTSNPRGFALIINNREFTDPSHNRAGSEHDYVTMQELFKQLHYEVEAHENVSSGDLKQILADFKAKFRIRNVDSCVVCIMSHGTSNTVLMADGVAVNYWTELIYHFDGKRFAHFEHKPKIFIVQACAVFSDGQPSPIVTMPTFATVPDLSNALVCFPTLPGTEARRDKLKGTWYINCLAQVVMNEAHRTEAKTLFGDMVQTAMKNVKSSGTASHLQLPLCIPMNFTKEFYFNPGVVYK